MTASLAGFLLGLSLIVAIGAQNAFVLRQGLRQQHVFAVCLVCALSDAILIAAGVAGFGTLVLAMPWLEPAMRYGGAAFLLAYALRSLRAAFGQASALRPSEVRNASLVPTLAICLAFTWLNPHVYLDTVMLLGSVSTQYDGQKLAFGIGAASASFLFFFALGYGARLLRPLFANPRSWRVLEIVIGFVMSAIAAKLVFQP
jgi:L-lysine exporter family protein LysE/ArgO